MKKKSITTKQIKDIDKQLKKLKLVPNKNGEITINVPFPDKIFEVGSLNKPADKEYYYSYLGASLIAQDLSRTKRDEAFGVWETKNQSTGKLYLIAYRGEIFVRDEDFVGKDK